jgi:hypothetical protein
VNIIIRSVCSPQEKYPQDAPGILKKPPEYGTGLFLFNGVTSGAFLAQGILWRSWYPGTGCCHDLVFEMGNLKKWGIRLGLSFPNQEGDFISREEK